MREIFLNVWMLAILATGLLVFSFLYASHTGDSQWFKRQLLAERGPINSSIMRENGKSNYE